MTTRTITTTVSPIVVTGGTGTIGRLVVARLRKAGHPVRVLSRGRRDHEQLEGVDFVTADLERGEGLDAALAGAGTIIHCAGGAKGDAEKAALLVAAARQAKTGHLVYITVVGDERIPVTSAIDRAMFGYFASKRAAGEAIASSGLPWTTLPVTQVHDLMLATMQQMARLPIIPAPAGFRFQPIDAGEVATRLVALALGAPAGRVPEMGGPRVYEMTDIIRGYLRAVGKWRPVLAMPMPGGAARAIREGANLAPNHAVGRRTWEEFLADRLASKAGDRLTPAP